jgi:hypothetical protein
MTEETVQGASGRDELIARARERSEGSIAPEEWGELLELDEDGGSFVGRYVGQAVDERWDPPRTVYLFIDEQDAPCYMPTRFRLEQEMSRVAVGETVAVYRGPDVETKAGNTVHTYGVESEPAAEPQAPEGDFPY